MARYFFNLRSPDKFIPDTEGQEFANLVAAKEDGLIAVREILSELVKSGRVIDTSALEITDASGTVRATIPLREALRFSAE